MTETNYVKIELGQKIEFDGPLYYDASDFTLIGNIQSAVGGSKINFGLLQKKEKFAIIVHNLGHGMITLLSLDTIHKRLSFEDIKFDRQADVTVFYHNPVGCEVVRFLKECENDE